MSAEQRLACLICVCLLALTFTSDGRWPHPVAQIYSCVAHPRLEKTGLCSHLTDLDAHKEEFKEKHGQLVNDQYVFLSTGTFKALKGPDRENLTKLQERVKYPQRK